MISRNVKYYCCEDPSLIENYELALSSDEEWDCHHRKETDENIPQPKLIEMGLYYNRPANELIFLIKGDHTYLHKAGKKNPYLSKWNTLHKRGSKDSPETKAKKSAAAEGENNPRARKVRCIETGQVFGCMKDAYSKYGCSKPAMRKALNTGCMAGGFHWEWV